MHHLLLLTVLLTCQSVSTSRKPVAAQQPTPPQSPPSCNCCVLTESKARSWRTRLAPDTTGGQPMRISGTVYESDGTTPARDVLLYFYHTNAQGYYAKHGNEPRTSFAWWHGHYRGWLRTDKQGRYEINTIKPGPYPHESIPAHIHFSVQAPSQKTCYYLSDFVFQGDPFLTDSYWYNLEQTEGFLRYDGVKLTNKQGILVGRRDLYLLPQFDKKPTQSGLLPGNNCPAFEPQHVWGPDRGKQICPMCTYGQKQGVMVWTTDIQSGKARHLAALLEQESRLRGPASFKVFIIYTNPGHLPARVAQRQAETFAQLAGLHHVSVLLVPSPTHKSTSFLYNINPAVTTTLLAFKQRRVAGKTVDPTAGSNAVKQLLSVLR